MWKTSEEVLERHLPTVIVEHRQREVPGQINVITDSETIGRLAADHLLKCGFRRFAYCGYADSSWSEERQVSFTRRIKAAGFDACVHWLPGSETRRLVRGWRRAFENWLKSQPKPLGLMACNDDLGLEVMDACRASGLRVPDEVAVIGADNDEVVCGLSDPPLSSVAICFERAGYESAGVLSRMMRGDKQTPSRIVVRASHVVPRRSTDIIAVEDANLAKALAFIRDHARKDMSVSEVARVAGVSRRALENRFRKLLNRSPLDEIRQTRANQIARLLVETELPVSQIAEATGFEDVRHVARYFRIVRGISPLVYRRTFVR